MGKFRDDRITLRLGFSTPSSTNLDGDGPDDALGSLGGDGVHGDVQRSQSQSPDGEPGDGGTVTPDRKLLGVDDGHVAASGQNELEGRTLSQENDDLTEETRRSRFRYDSEE